MSRRECRTSPPGDVVWLKLHPGSLILPDSLFPLWFNVQRTDSVEWFSEGRTPRPSIQNIKSLLFCRATLSHLPLPLIISWALLYWSGCCCLFACDTILAASVVTEMKECCILISMRYGQTYVTLQVGSPVILFLLPALLCFHFFFFCANVHSPTGCDCYNNIHKAVLECQPDLSTPGRLSSLPRQLLFPSNVSPCVALLAFNSCLCAFLFTNTTAGASFSTRPRLAGAMSYLKEIKLLFSPQPH